jgi:hypothetical protein
MHPMQFVQIFSPFCTFIYNRQWAQLKKGFVIIQMHIQHIQHFLRKFGPRSLGEEFFLLKICIPTKERFNLKKDFVEKLFLPVESTGDHPFVMQIRQA